MIHRRLALMLYSAVLWVMVTDAVFLKMSLHLQLLEVHIIHMLRTQSHSQKIHIWISAQLSIYCQILSLKLLQLSRN